VGIIDLLVVVLVGLIGNRGCFCVCCCFLCVCWCVVCLWVCCFLFMFGVYGEVLLFFVCLLGGGYFLRC